MNTSFDLNYSYGFLFENVIKRKGYFLISNQTLHEIENGFYHLGMVYGPLKLQFDNLLKREGLTIKPIDSELSIIKKIA